MKKCFLIISFCLCFIFVSCGKIQKEEPVNNVNYIVAQKLQEIDNNYSNETLKALTIAIRNNVLINHETLNDGNIDEKYLAITKVTDNKILKDNKNNLIEISFDDNNDYVWQKNIKKNQILEFALQNNISLTSLTNIEEVTENGRVVGLNIGNQFFDYGTLANYFGLESNKIESISSNKNEIIIKGKGNSFYNHFDIEKAEQLSIDNHNYLEILSIIFDNLSIF